MKRIFVTGASGFLGSYICHALLERGYAVYGLVRELPSHENLIQSVRYLEGSLDEKEKISSFLKENLLEMFVHTAAFVSDWGRKHIFYDTNLKGTENMLEASKEAGLKAFIHISTIDVMHYDRRGHHTLSELTNYSKSRYYYQNSKTLAEIKALEYSLYYKVVAIRPAWIFGPGDKTLFPEILKNLRQGFLLLPGKKNTYIPMVFAGSLSQFIVDLVDQIESLPNNLKINVADESAITWRELIDLLRKKFYPHAIVLNVPYRICFLLAVIIESLYKIFGIQKRPVLTTGSLPMVASSISVDRSLMKEFLILERPNFEETLQSTIRWYEGQLKQR